MMASPPIETAVDCPRPAAVSVEEISVVMPPERDITPTGPGEYAFSASRAGPPMPPILITPGTMMPWTMNVVSSPIRIDMTAGRSWGLGTRDRGLDSYLALSADLGSRLAHFLGLGWPHALALDLLDGAARRLVHRHRAVAVLDA